MQANTPMAVTVGGYRRERGKAMSCKRRIRKEEQEMNVGATRSELVVIAVVLMILMVLAVLPALWGTALGQEGKITNVAVRISALEGTVGTRSAGGQDERLPGASLELVNLGLNSSHVWVSRTSR